VVVVFDAVAITVGEHGKCRIGVELVGPVVVFSFDSDGVEI
jgi:hypothetical protein